MDYASFGVGLELELGSVRCENGKSDHVGSDFVVRCDSMR